MLAAHENTPASTYNVLFVATLFKMPYRVLRCIAASGATIYVLGTRGAKDLRCSRYCKEYFSTTRLVDGRHDRALAEEINFHVQRLNINFVLAGDAPATRSLIAIRDLVTCRSFPSPDARQFDLLNDKWEFTELCATLDLPCPVSQLVDSKDELIQKIDAGQFAFPVIVKPLSMDAGRGCLTLRQKEHRRRQVASITYAPIMVQEFIHGENISASVYCEEGRVLAFTCYRYARATFSIFFHRQICADVTKLVQYLQLSGVINFDIMLAPSGRIFYLECNPRFFYSIALCMLAGINFVQYGLDPPTTSVEPQLPTKPITLYLPKAVLASLYAPWKLRGKFSNVLKFLLADPVPYLLEEIGLENQIPEAWDAFTASLADRYQRGQALSVLSATKKPKS